MPPLTEAEIAALRALLAGVAETALSPELATKLNAAFNSNITAGAISGNTIGLATRQGNAVELGGNLPSIPSDTITQGQLDTAINGVNQVPTDGSQGDFLVRGSTPVGVWTPFELTTQGSWRLGMNHLEIGIPPNTTGLTELTPRLQLNEGIIYALVFQGATDAVPDLVFAIGNNRPKAANDGTYVFTSTGISITNGFNASLIGIHRIAGTGERGPAGPPGTSFLNISDNLLTQALASNGSSRTVVVPPAFNAPKGVYIGTQTTAFGYNDHQILTPFRTGNQNVYRRDGVGFSFPAAHTIRADSGFDANDRIISMEVFPMMDQDTERYYARRFAKPEAASSDLINFRSYDNWRRITNIPNIYAFGLGKWCVSYNDKKGKWGISYKEDGQRKFLPGLHADIRDAFDEAAGAIC